MLKDPSYLADLGEFGSLKNAIACSFHQDAFAIHGDVEKIIEDFWQGHGSDSANLIKFQLEQLLQGSDGAMQALWDQYSDWIVAGPFGARKIFEALLAAYTQK